MTEKIISKKEERAYRLCHHSFDGLSVSDAADVMRLTPRRVQQLLISLEKKAPQLFPILTLTQARDYHLYCDEGWTLKDIMFDTGRSISTISESIKAAIVKGMPRPKTKNKNGTVERFHEGLNNIIKEKF